ncbi:TolQ protein [Candidatus Blochmanniella floridana]|uniref:TolQ protein n=1 Tax=Blochmanniella floridana TaxID=203907 RepID=Q7VR87_BLOFL|nr:TolQ protein [Candidatus Blochmannia floridanus]
MNILGLFLKTNFLVQITIFILIIFSIVSWSIIFHRVFILKYEQRKLKSFENKFWSGIELPRLYIEISNKKNQLSSVEHIFYIGFKEFSRLHKIKKCLSETIASRTLRVMNNTLNLELEKLESYIPLIGTIGSISPYVGLFGTVLGIIHVFIALDKISAVNSNHHMGHIHLIAPGIAEALISTAIGLFVAIPAVMAFNYLTTQINNLNQNFNNFIEEFITILYRQVFLHSNSKQQETQNEEKTSKIHDSI